MAAQFRLRRVLAHVAAAVVTARGVAVGCAEAAKSEWNPSWDGAVGARTKHHLVLVRHGQYVYGKTDKERKLTELGREQARETGKRLADLEAKGVIPPIKYILYSTMTRATETYEIISEELGPCQGGPSAEKDKLRDIKPSDLIREGPVCKPVPPHPTWNPTPEEFKKANDRVEKGFKEIIKRAPPSEDTEYTTLLVCHGNVIRYFALKALQLPPERWLSLAVYNASITFLKVNPDGGVSCRGLGDVGHFSPDKITYG